MQVQQNQSNIGDINSFAQDLSTQQIIELLQNAADAQNSAFDNETGDQAAISSTQLLP